MGIARYEVCGTAILEETGTRYMKQTNFFLSLTATIRIDLSCESVAASCLWKKGEQKLGRTVIEKNTQQYVMRKVYLSVASNIFLQALYSSK